MAVSAPVIPPPPLTPTSTPLTGGLFRTDSVYTSPSESPKLSSIGNNINSGNECKMVELRGVKVASFNVDGQELICLPQVFDLFLKHLVGGLHTVYTKLKRLDITPVVCTVEQVRILRGLGAIQPGVNRCKLISRKDFETLFNDCTNASSRPGRPPKRTLSVTLPENSRIMPHAVPGLLSPGIISPTGLTAAAMAEAMKLQKLKLATMNNLHGNGSQNGAESENEELNSSSGGCESSWDKEKLQSPTTTGSQHVVRHAILSGQHNLAATHSHSPFQQNRLRANRLELPFMMMPHPLIPVSLPPASVTMAMSQMSHLSTIANMAVAAQMHNPLSRAGASVIKGMPLQAGKGYAHLLGQPLEFLFCHQERVHNSLSPEPSLEDSQRPGSHPSSHQSSSISSSPSQHDIASDRISGQPREGEIADHDNGPNIKRSQKEKGCSIKGPKDEPGDSIQTSYFPWIRSQDRRSYKCQDETQLVMPTIRTSIEKFHMAGQVLPPGFPAPFLFADGLSSIETLLTNIQGLLKVAVDNARVQEKQIQQEKKELKLELFREREMRETLERQLTTEQHNRATIQKRLKKEKKAKRKLQEALEFESKRREQVEQALQQVTSTESLRVLNDAVIPEMEAEHCGTQLDTTPTVQDRPYMKTSILY
ncbi:dachshund homolog 2 isoform X2 [Amblyraja radiata]|uniref:dachshund homolog 2 isoform X2 n=1 Tax=Amblyraja radiata TaxID=386614 RepID=UPI001403CEA2|nr:dachshund homolog 2 isoform X2 [Amblyraja radiata]